MQSVGDTGLIGSNATYLNGLGCIGRATVCERRSNKGNDVISAGKDEVTDETFVSVDDEISAEFFWFLVVLHKFCRRHSTQVTARRLKRLAMSLSDEVTRRTWRNLPGP